VGWLWIALLACAVAVLVAAEWPRLSGRLGLEARRRRERARRKSQLKLLRTESDEFEAAVQRDLEQLPVTKEQDRERPG
jgi:adenine-specific DNA methylase